MVVLELRGEFLNFDTTKDGEICKILSEAKPVYNEVLKKDIVNCDVEKNGVKFVYSPNLSACKALQNAFGMDTKDWIGKKFEIIHIDKKMSIRPIKEQKV